MSKWAGIDEFVAVATAGSFSAGAEAFGASTTHMSRAIARLEARVQAQLFHRTTRVVKLTDTGKTFLQHCERIIQERDEAIGLISESGAPQGDLRVTCSSALGERFVAPIVRRYALQHPRLSVGIVLSNWVVDLVAEGFDLAIRTGALTDSRLIGRRIASRTLYTCASPAYLERRPAPRVVADLAQHECLVGTSSTWQFKTAAGEEIFRPKGRFRCNSGSAIVEAALVGMGICQLPEFYVLPYLADGRLQPLLEPYRPDDQPIWAVYPQRRHLLPKVAALVDRLRTELPVALAQLSHLRPGQAPRGLE